jgi:hypothetical protein
VEYLAAGVAAVSSKGDLSGEEVVHAEVEEGYVLLITASAWDDGVDTQIHVAVDGGIVMSDQQPSRRWEESRE